MHATRTTSRKAKASQHQMSSINLPKVASAATHGHVQHTSRKK